MIARQKEHHRSSPGADLHRAASCETRPLPGRENNLLRLQRSAGNQAALRALGHATGSARGGSSFTLTQPGDRYEREADRVAAAVMSPAHEGSFAGAGSVSPVSLPSISRVPAGNSAGPSQMSGGAGPASSTERAAHAGLQSAGRPLEPGLRALMEPRFGRDFGKVRIHTGAAAADSARALNAKAFTHGNDIVFGQKFYSPNDRAGQRLLAHELAHVAQQSDGGASGFIQRAEVDDRSCAGLTDIESDINAKVNTEIRAARAGAGTPVNIPRFLEDVKDRLGAGAVSPIENFIEAMPATKRRMPPSSLAGTKYAGVEAVNRFYRLQTLGLAHVVGSAAKIHNICVGADKLGHFFQEGYIYYTVATTPGLGGTTAAAQSTGRALEIGIQGLSSTGVYSNADQAANAAGMQFYRDLAATPTMTFSVSRYITTAWNEQSNPSFYESSVGGVVWNNLLSGNWRGPFMQAGSAAPTDTNVSLSATGTTVVGTYEYPAASPTVRGAITNGAITQNTTSVSGTIPGRPAVSATPVTGINIDYDWTQGSSSGKGRWVSVNEQTLQGTWGSGTSRTNGGTWQITKV